MPKYNNPFSFYLRFTLPTPLLSLSLSLSLSLGDSRPGISIEHRETKLNDRAETLQSSVTGIEETRNEKRATGCTGYP